jgi:hypothetical protein
MANTLSAVMPKILARGLMALREQAVMPRLVNADYSAEAAKRGDTIDVPLPSAITAGDVTPSTTPPVPTSLAANMTQIQLNNWKRAGFHLTDREVLEIEADETFVPMQMSEAIRALANAVNESVHAEYRGVYGAVGTAGGTPFAADVSDATAARKLLNKQLAPRADRRGVLDFDAEANALALPQFSDAEKVGSATVKIDGEIGRKFGIDWYADDGVPTHTAGTAADSGSFAITAGAVGSVGDPTATLTSDVGAPTLVEGDVISFAGHDQTYVVSTGVGLSTGNTVVNLSPALKAAVSNGTAGTVQRSHVVNLAFHRDAFALAMRPLAAGLAELSLGNQILAMTDAQTGLSLRLEVSRQYKQTVWEFDVLWGVKLVRPELAVRIVG